MLVYPVVAPLNPDPRDGRVRFLQKMLNRVEIRSSCRHAERPSRQREEAWNVSGAQPGSSRV